MWLISLHVEQIAQRKQGENHGFSLNRLQHRCLHHQPSNRSHLERVKLDLAMISNVAKHMIQARVLQVNEALGRPKHYFILPNGGDLRAAVGHLAFNCRVGPHYESYQLAEVINESGDEKTDIFGLSGQYLKADCFYTVLNVILACSKR